MTLKLIKMKRVVIVAVCIVGFLGFTSCGSTAPCGLSQQTKQNKVKYQESEVIVLEAIAE